VSAPPLQAARTVRKPMPARAGAVTWKVARTDAPGATRVNVATSDARAVQPGGNATVRRTFSIGAVFVLTKLTVTSLAAFGVKLVRRVCVRRATSYFAP